MNSCLSYKHLLLFLFLLFNIDSMRIELESRAYSIKLMIHVQQWTKMNEKQSD